MNKQERGAGVEADTCVTALDISEGYRSQINRPLEHLGLAQQSH